MTKDQVRSTEEAISTERALDLALEALATEEYRLRQTGQSQVYPGIGFAITAIKQARSAPVQEPVFCEYCGGNDDADFGLPTDHCTDCARPQPAAQRQWVGLTDEEYEKTIRDNMLLQMNFAGIRDDIEAKLKAKNFA